jgi:hypothetical protein
MSLRPWPQRQTKKSDGGQHWLYVLSTYPKSTQIEEKNSRIRSWVPIIELFEATISSFLWKITPCIADRLYDENSDSHHGAVGILKIEELNLSLIITLYTWSWIILIVKYSLWLTSECSQCIVKDRWGVVFVNDASLWQICKMGYISQCESLPFLCDVFPDTVYILDFSFKISVDRVHELHTNNLFLFSKKNSTFSCESRRLWCDSFDQKKLSWEFRASQCQDLIER